MKRGIIDAESYEISLIHAQVPDARLIRPHIYGVRGDRHGSREVYLLPAGWRLVYKRRTRKERAGTAPKMCRMCTRISVALIKSNSRYVPVAVRLELDSKL